MPRREKLDTTLGELIAALTDETIEVVPDERLADTLVAYMLAEIFSTSRMISKTWH